MGVQCVHLVLLSFKVHVVDKEGGSQNDKLGVHVHLLRNWEQKQEQKQSTDTGHKYMQTCPTHAGIYTNIRHRTHMQPRTPHTSRHGLSRHGLDTLADTDVTHIKAEAN